MRQIKRIYLYLGAPLGGRQRFTLGTFEDLKVNGIEPQVGLKLQFYSDDCDASGKRDDLVFEGEVGFDAGSGWYAVVEEGDVQSESEVISPENSGCSATNSGDT